MNNVNVVCINWGDKYAPEYVMRLHAMIARNTTKSFKLYCLTDKPDAYQSPIISLKLPSGLEGWWNKMLLFKPGILPNGEYLYFDLDVVIVDNIDCFFEFENFGITRDFINPEEGLLEGKEYNSSIMRFSQNEELWNFFVANQNIWKANQERVNFFGDQNVISAYLNRHDYNSPFPDAWIWSFKIGSIRGQRPLDHTKFLGAEIPENGKICVFHGRPNPSEVSIDWVSENWCESKSTADPKQQISVSKSTSHHVLSINDYHFKVPHHWFWDQFSERWEPQTYNFFHRNLKKGSTFLDIGGWVGPTAFIATSLGADKVKIIEPNPVNFFHLLSSQFNNGLMAKWFLVNACISDRNGDKVIGPIKGIESGSSATHIRDQNQEGARIISLRLEDIVRDEDNLSLIKIDIEGAEELIINDLSVFAPHNVAIWLSLHPPHYENKDQFLINLLALKKFFIFVDENNSTISDDILSHRLLSIESYPSWGTEWGNLFEIGLLSRQFFAFNGHEYSRLEEFNQSANNNAA
ncbi:FkbM family methyltransferase [Alphaproteobacteria bacterium]|nr:FkbM family methyltransferase [Alphaproteobacteria bacterium]